MLKVDQKTEDSLSILASKALLQAESEDIRQYHPLDMGVALIQYISYHVIIRNSTTDRKVTREDILADLHKAVDELFVDTSRSVDDYPGI